jgi:ribosomal protein S18 acetylase RimI-like enzyme/tRNA(Leu) C34 or U34 (ribose-2'-O)-methylase TrmL
LQDDVKLYAPINQPSVQQIQVKIMFILPTLTLLLAGRQRHAITSPRLHRLFSSDGRQNPRPTSVLHLTEASYADDVTADLSYRHVQIEDMSRCYEIESSSYPEDESATLEKLIYRQQHAGEYFICVTKPHDETSDSEHIIGFICSTRCSEFTEESMSEHDANGSILAIHSVVVDEKYRRQGVASAMLKEYLTQMISFSSLVASTGTNGFSRILLLAKSHLLSFYVDCGFAVIRPSPIVHGQDTWYELEARREYLERLLRLQSFSTNDDGATATRVLGTSRSTSNPDYAPSVIATDGHEKRRSKLHEELLKIGISPSAIEENPELFGTAAIRTYNSFLLPKSKGALAVAESPTRARVVANNISFLAREFKADQEAWLRNVDRNRVDSKSQSEGKDGAKNPIVIVLDNVRSAHNVGNILRLAEAAQVESVRLCGMTPRPPHPKVMKTAMGAAEYVSLGDDTESSLSTLRTVLDLKAKGYEVYGVETTETAICIWDAPISSSSSPVAFVFGNELIGVGE